MRICLLLVTLWPCGALAGGPVTDCANFGPGVGTLEAALAGGGTVTFSCDGTIVVPSTAPAGFTISTDTVLDATGRLVTLDGADSNRIVVVDAGSSLELVGLVLTDGLAFSDPNFPSSAGGCIQNFGNLTVRSSVITGCFGVPGGAISNEPNASLAVVNASFLQNGSQLGGSGIRNAGDATVSASTFHQNNNSSGSALGDGTLFNDVGGEMTVSNSTISGNLGDVLGGGLFNLGTTHSINSTFANNSVFTARQIASTLPGTITLTNTVLATHSCGDEGIIDGGNNIDPQSFCGFSPANGSKPFTNAMLGPLQDNGGPTLTHLPLPTSPAIGMGDPFVCASSPVGGVDQRGLSRTAHGTCDMGAAEFDATIVSVPRPVAAAIATLLLLLVAAALHARPKPGALSGR